MLSEAIKQGIRSAAAPNITVEQAQMLATYDFQFLRGVPLGQASYLIRLTERYWRWFAVRRSRGYQPLRYERAEAKLATVEAELAALRSVLERSAAQLDHPAAKETTWSGEYVRTWLLAILYPAGDEEISVVDLWRDKQGRQR